MHPTCIATRPFGFLSFPLLSLKAVCDGGGGGDRPGVSKRCVWETLGLFTVAHARVRQIMLRDLIDYLTLVVFACIQVLVGAVSLLLSPLFYVLERKRSSALAPKKPYKCARAWLPAGAHRADRVPA